MLHGRAAELDDLHKLPADARAGHSSMLVLSGEAGSGKTALLEQVAADAKDFTVLRCTGVESEAELPFAALHLLLLDRLERLESLPAPQAAALRAAFGLAEAPGVDRFLTGLATLTLLSDVAAGGPVLCMVDDAQWVDKASLDALLFAGRRLGAEGVVLLISMRDGDGEADLRGLRVVGLRGLSQPAAAALLGEQAADLAPDLRDRLIVQASGNPLALIEFAAAARLGDPTVGGLRSVRSRSSTAACRVLDTFGSQVDTLPAGTGMALLVVAAEDTGELGVVLAALARIGLGLNNFEPAERMRLVRVVDDGILFRHPLIRSAVYGRAPAADRIIAHRALADVLPQHDDRRAWHLASAAGGFDDEAAAAMEAAALRADRRGGYAVSAAAHERAARLTANPVMRGTRLAAAAMAARDSGQLDRAGALAHEASALAEDPRTLAKLEWVRARLEFERGTPRHASEMVLAGAELVYECDPEAAARMLIEVVRMAYFAEEAPQLAHTAELINALSLPADHPLRPMLEASSILARLLSGEPEEQIPPLPTAVREIRPEQLGMTVGNLAIHSPFLLMIIGDADEAWAQTERMLIEARERGLIGGLPHILLQHSQAELAAGRLREALRAANEGVQIAEDTGQLHSAANLRGVVARIAAMTGDEDTCVALANEAIHLGAERHSSSVGLAVLAMAVLELGFGRYAGALERLTSLAPQLRRHPTFAYVAPPEWAEAAARSGQPQRAAEMMAAYVPWASRRTSPLVLANVHRCHALLGPDDEAEAHYQAAIGLYDRINRPMARARTELLYGEWLRRVRRRAESREPLRAALRVFERIGARSWAERARAELRATGESVAAAVEPGAVQLTPQELHVVRLAATGLSNRDIGAQLFISPRTVGYHLYKAFPKLGVAGRRELAALDLS
ncbi:MAG TPA: AAA family ATPase [Mycobacterium sp.]|nr:AAA family ATPase [Mycobacterium sp.]